MDKSLWDRVEDIGARFPRTETIQLSHADLRLFAKMEMTNPSGSAKDRSAYWILREAVRRGEVTRDTVVVESSSGNFALAMALFCRELGIDFIPVIDPNVNTSTEWRLRRVCARVERVDEPDGAGGFLLGRLDRVARLVAEIDDAYWPNQYANVDGARGHSELTGRELTESLGAIDYLFVGVGSGATITGLSQRVTGATVVAVDVAGSVIFGGLPRRRVIPGIGSSIRPPLLDQAVIDDVVVVTEWDEVAGCRALLADQGIHAGGSTGCVYAAINRYFAGHTGPAPVVAFLCADRGAPYQDTVYDAEWVARNVAPTGNPPVVAHRSR
jgi:cysteine synthase A